MAGRTFRVFVSSTFSDLKVERNALGRWVFPRLRALCESRGYKFQAVDLRWGVRDEAAADQQTVRICLDEIARCQRLSPRPNFIVLLGDRYGWCPPPSAIPANEMDVLRPYIATDAGSLVFGDPGAPDDADLVAKHGWYRRDENAVPAEYVLQPRLGAFEKYEVWEPVERRLREALAEAAEHAGLGEATRRKYRASATELETMKGAVDAPDAQKHVFAFFRAISNLDDVKAALPGAGARELIDTLPGNTWDANAWNAQGRLRQLLTDRIGKANVWAYDARWTTNGALDLSRVVAEMAANVAPPPTDGVLPITTNLCEAVWQRLSRVIATEMDALDRESRDPLETEKRAHSEFAEDRRRVFIGRREPLARIAAYLNGGPGRPLVVHGLSGSGKSALMAQAIAEARTAHPEAVIVERFIGAAVGASEVRPLLESVGRELTRALGGDESTIPAAYDKLVSDFPARLALARPEAPAFVFLDALDQLGESDDGRRLVWLPRELPPHVRIVVSTLPEAQYQCFPELSATAEPDDLVAIAPMTAAEGGEILDAWLASVRRAVTSTQRDGVLGCFRVAGLPLYLKLAFEESRRWHSYDGNGPAAALSVDVVGMIRALYARLSASEHGARVVSHALGYLAAARYGLSDEEMLDLLWRDREVRAEIEEHARKHHKLPEGTDALPPVIWSRLYFDLEPYLAMRDVFGVPLLGFYHRQLREVAAEDYVASRKARVHGDLADYFAERWQAPETHALLELVPQLVGGGRNTEARELLLQYRWMSTKLAATNVHVLTGDYDELSLDRQEPAGLVGGALRLSSHVLGARPQELASQVIGRMLGLELPELREIAEVARRDAPRPALVPLWPSLDAPGGPLLRTLEGHQNRVWSVAVSRDEKTAVSGSGDKTLKVWDLVSGKLSRTLEGHWRAVRSVVLTEDGATAVSGSEDKTLKVWDLVSGKLLHTLESDQSYVNSVAVSRDRKAVVAGCQYQTLKVWDLASGALLHTLEGHQDGVMSVALSGDGRTAVSGSSDKTLKVWDLASGKLLRTLEGHQGGVNSVVLSGDGRTAVSGSSDKTLKVWDLASGALLRTLEGHQDGVNSVALSGDGRTAVSGSSDKTLKVWDLASGKLLRTFDGHQDGVDSVVLSGDGKTAVSGSSDKTLKVWDLASGKLLRTFDGHQGAVNSVAVSGDGTTAVSGSWDKTLKVWDLASGKLLRTFDGHQGAVILAAVSRDGTTVVSRDHALKVWDVTSGNLLRTLDAPQDWEKVGLSRDGTTAVSHSNTGKTLKVWDVASGKLLRTLDCRNDVWWVAVSGDGTTALSGSLYGDMQAWNLASGKLLRTLDGRHDHNRSVAVSGDGTTAVSGSASDRALKVWDLSSGKLLRTLEDQGGVIPLAVSGDGTTAVFGTDDKTLEVWDLASGKVIASFTGDGGFRSAAFSPDGHRILAGDRLGRLHLLELLLADGGHSPHPG